MTMQVIPTPPTGIRRHAGLRTTLVILWAATALSAALPTVRASPAPPPAAPSTQPAPAAGGCEATGPSHDGIGKVYMGREIAQVMGHLAADWLDRPERER